MPQEWSDRARKVVTGWQERAYGDLGVDLGLGWAPMAAYERLARPLLPEERTSGAKAREMLGDDIVPGGDWDDFDCILAEYKRRYFVEPPTPYEEPNLSSCVAEHLDTVLDVLSTSEWTLPARPLVATLPSGELNARIRRIPATDEAAVLFQHGLLMYLHTFAMVVAMAVPAEWLALPLRAADPDGDEPGGRDATVRAIDLLAAGLTAYVVHGTPSVPGAPLPTGRALVSAGALGRAMRLFVISHELMHLLLGHLAVPVADLTTEERWRRELDADMAGSSVAARAGEDTGMPLVVGLWACDLALAAFDLVERVVAYLETGSIDGPPSDSHPPPVRRRQELLRTKTEDLMREGLMADSARLGDLTLNGAQLVERLFEATGPHWVALREQRVRPSPIWTRRADKTAT